MELENTTRLVADWTLAHQPDGREAIVVVAKATYRLVDKGHSELTLEFAEDEQQVPLTEEDQFTGEDGLSAPLYETDYAQYKPACDVLFNGSGKSPQGRPATTVPVALQVAGLVKSFDVVGTRHWRFGLTGLAPSAPEPFVSMPISYDNAFGGTDDSLQAKSGKVYTCLPNPVGRGYVENQAAIDGKALPNTAETGRPVTSTNNRYRPMALGSIGRAWAPRAKFAGTYDTAWLDNRCPLLPLDFDLRHFQAAPPDQQIPYPRGGELIGLQNLTPRGVNTLRLPDLELPCRFLPHRGDDLEREAVVDTILIEPDQERLCLTWRLCFPLQRRASEINKVVLGKLPRAYHSSRRAALTGKTYYSNLAELVSAKRKESGR